MKINTSKLTPVFSIDELVPNDFYAVEKLQYLYEYKGPTNQSKNKNVHIFKKWDMGNTYNVMLTDRFICSKMKKFSKKQNNLIKIMKIH